ncbi:MAG: hypothetical protein ACXWIU_03745 [Limisphaerales bacterium]
MKKTFLLFVIALSVSSAFAVKPDPNLTPGELCTPSNPDFTEYRYPAHIAYCKRNVTEAMKQKIAEAYGGIPRDQWSNYEFDHLIPLNAGGDSSIANLWPQPIAEAKEKDKVEQQTYNGLNNGKLTQAQAVQMIWDWMDQH